MKTLGYYNGEIGELEDMRVPMLDRGCYFGDGVYDATYCRNYKLFALGEHLDRFFDGAKAVGINIGMEKAQLASLIAELVKKLSCGDQFVYFQATRGTGLREHSYDENSRANLWVMLEPRPIKAKDKRYHIMSAEDKRYTMCNIKTLNLLPNVIAAQQAKTNGFDEVVFVRGGRVSECGHSNICMLVGGALVKAPKDNLSLDGIAQRHLAKAALSLDIPVIERQFCLEQIMLADEVIVTSSGALCMRVDSIDKKRVGGLAPDIFNKLQAEVFAEFEGEVAEDD